MGLFDKRLGVDLGTVNTLIYENGQIVLQEPTLVALTPIAPSVTCGIGRR